MTRNYFCYLLKFYCKSLKFVTFSEKGSEKASKPKVYKCSPCDKTFDSHNNLQMHNAVSHAKAEPIEYDQGM